MTSAGLRDQLQRALGAQYSLERELGHGGMATVYLAEDTKHHRQVALKVLHSDLATSLGGDRFRREVQLVARLQHPHILTVHDSGETATGQLWFTMPYVEGETLRDRLRRQRQLPLDDAVRITRDVALALDYAHRHGVVHRDVKPENILLVDGQAMVADFGIARALSPPVPGDTLTATGVAIGTPAYMSPEQTAGERVLDGAADTYSLGVCLYEMLAGEPPYTGPTAQAIAAKMMAAAPPTVRRTRPTVPAAVDAAIQKALAPVPADRFATAADFARALERGWVTATPGHTGRLRLRIAIGAVIVVLAAGGYALRARVRSAASAAAPPAGPLRLAVLPFDNLGDSADGYFADGMTDAVREKLIAITGLEVIAPTSSTQYRHSTKPLAEIGRELGARYLVIGKVRWAKTPGSPSRVEVQPALVDAASASDKWEQSFDAPLTDVFHVQAEIADKVASQLRLTLTPATQQTVAARPTQNLAAYDAYLRGRAMIGRSGSAVVQHRAAAIFREAVRLDSTFAEAWALLAFSEVNSYVNGVPDPALADSARQAAERAVAVAPDWPLGHGALGFYYTQVSLDWPRARAEFAAGLARAPSHAGLLRGMGDVETRLGRWGAALDDYQQAATLDPRSGGVASALTGAELWVRQYSAAREAADHGIELSPNNPGNVEDRIMVALADGNLPEARSVLRAAWVAGDTAALTAYVATYRDLGWVLDTAQDRVLFGLGPAAFDNDKATWGMVLAQQYALRGDAGLARAFADTARAAFEAHLRRAPDDAQQHVMLGLAFAYLGRKADAVREGLRGVAIVPIAHDAKDGPYFQHQLARIYIKVGEPEKALDALEPLLKIPYYLSPSWLRIDPNFAPLRGNPRFERLIAQPATGERPIA